MDTEKAFAAFVAFASHYPYCAGGPATLGAELVWDGNPTFAYGQPKADGLRRALRWYAERREYRTRAAWRANQNETYRPSTEDAVKAASILAEWED